MRGSIALEFLLVVLAIVIYVGFSVAAARTVALNTAEDISDLARTREAMNKIYNAVVFLSAGSEGSSTTVTFYVPTDANIVLSGKTITGTVNVDGNFDASTYCSGGVCTFAIQVPIDFNATYSFPGGITYRKVLTKTGGKVGVS